MSWDSQAISTLVQSLDGGDTNAGTTLIDRVVDDARAKGASVVLFATEPNHGSVRYVGHWDEPMERMRLPVVAQKNLVSLLTTSGRATADGDSARLTL